MTAPTAPVTVADLLDTAGLGAAVLLGGDAGRLRPVLDAVLVPVTGVTSAPLAAGSVLVLETPPTELRWGHLVEVALRRAAEAGLPAVVLPSTGEVVAASTTRVADALGVALVRLPPDLATGAAALLITLAVRAPELTASTMVLQLAGRAGSGTRAPEQVVATLAEVLACRAGLVSAAAGVVAGDAGGWTPHRLRALPEPLPLPTEEPEGTAVVTPLRLRPGPPSGWLVLHRGRTGPRWAALARRVTTVVHGELLVWLATEQLRTERQARIRSTLLADVVEGGALVTPTLAEQAREVGWELSGQHTGLHVQVVGGTPEPGAVAEALRIAALGAEEDHPGLVLAAPVERSDGWAGWLTSTRPPSPATLRTLTARLRTAFAELARSSAVRVVVGIGSTQQDAPGIATTLAEARDAAMVPPEGPEPVEVRAVHDLGAGRLLLGWAATPAFRTRARQLLAPLLDSGDETLLTTLEAYLNRSQSAAHTARALNLHRNTVHLRIARAEKLLGTTLAASETRLALHLALRALGPERDRSGVHPAP